MEQFSAEVTQTGSKVSILLPFDPNVTWGEKERHHVRGEVDGYAFRGPLAFESGKYILVLGAAWRRDTGIQVGDVVKVTLSPEGPQMDNLPEDVVAALQADDHARVFFESLATFYRKGYLRWIQGARQPEMRTARIAEMMQLLKSGKKQREK